METVVNFRDLGGLKNKDGQRIKTGKLYRSGQLVGVSEEDTHTLLNTYHLKTIIDFRGDSELKDSPDDTIPGTKYVHINILKDDESNSAGFKNLIEHREAANNYMKEIYEKLVLSPGSLTGYRQFMEIVADSQAAPLDFHCFAGKDRTGMGAAIILEILGVEREVIYADYLKTNSMRKKANDEIIAELAKKGMTDDQLKGMETMMYVDKEYLDTAYAIIEEKYGSFAGFIKDGLNLPDDIYQKMADLYLE